MSVCLSHFSAGVRVYAVLCGRMVCRCCALWVCVSMQCSYGGVGVCLCCALWMLMSAVLGGRVSMLCSVGVCLLCGSTCCALCACVYAVLCVWGAYAVLCGATCCALWVRVSELCSVGVGAYAVLSLCVCLHCALGAACDSYALLYGWVRPCCGCAAAVPRGWRKRHCWSRPSHSCAEGWRGPPHEWVSKRMALQVRPSTGEALHMTDLLHRWPSP